MKFTIFKKTAYILVFLVLSCISFIVCGFSVAWEREAILKQTEIQKLGNVIRQASDFLREQANLYVITGDIYYRDNYFRELYDKKNSELAIETILALGKPTDGNAIAEQVKVLSEELYEHENEMFFAMENGNIERAKQMLFEKKYADTKKPFLNQVDTFLISSSYNFERDTSRAHQLVIVSLPLFLVFFVLSMILIARMFARDGSDFRKISNLVAELKDSLAYGEFSKTVDTSILKTEWQQIASDVKEIYSLPKSILVDNAPVVFMLLEDGVVIDSNEYVKKNLDIKEGDVLENFVTSRERYYEILRILEANNFVYGEKIVYKNIRGDKQRFSVNIGRIKGRGSEISVLWGFNIEHDENQIEHLKRIQGDLQKLIDVLPIAMIIQDPTNSVILYGNNTYFTMFECSSFEHIYGFSEEKLYSENQLNGMNPYELEKNNVRKILESNITVQTEFQYHTHRGTIIDTRVTSAEILYNGQRSILKVIQDITTEKAQITLLSLAADKEREANQIKSRFLVNMSHEIRTPMNAIIGMSQLSILRGGESNDIDSFQKINTSAKNLLTIINDILDFSKMEAQKMELVIDKFNLEEVLSNAVMIAMERLDQKPVQILIKIAPDVPFFLNGDRIRLWQVLKNLLDNSAKYTNAGRITLEVENVAQSGDEVTLQFVITDSGMGMSEAQLEKLFTPFEQFHNNEVSVNTGTGLGMSIIKQLLELMGGELVVTSAMNKGTTSKVKIKFTIAEEDSTLLRLARATEMQGKRILVVESDEVSNEIMCTLIKLMGAEPIEALSTLEALEKVRNNTQIAESIGIVILERGSIEKTGIDISDTLRAHLPDAKFIKIASAARKLSDEEVKRQGFSELIEKPFVPTKFYEKLTKSITKKVKLEKWHGETFKKARVLLCEDNLTNQEVALGMLELLDVETVVADNGRDGLEKLESEHFDIVLMDILMPVMDGYEATKIIRKSKKPYQNIPILALTANVMTEEVSKCQKVGMNSHIAKPIEFDDLKTKLAIYLDSEYILSAAEKSMEVTEAVVPEVVQLPKIENAYGFAIEGVDIAEGVTRFVGKVDRYKKALLRVASDLETPMPEFDSPDLLIFAHTIKGVAGNMGITELYETSLHLEKSVKANEPSRELYDKLKEVRAVYAARIKTAFEEKHDLGTQTKVQKEVGTDSLLNELLIQLKESLETYDPTRSDEMILKLKEKSWEKLGEQAIDEIYQMTQNYEFDEALAKLTELNVIN